MYRITIRDRNGAETLGHFEPNTAAACAGAMVALYSCAPSRRTVEHALKTRQSYSASNSQGGMVRAEWIADTRAEAIAHAQRSGAWPMPRPRPCQYCGFVAPRMSDDDCPAKPRYLRAWHWLLKLSKGKP